ncbi:hypothetical protein ACR78F_04990 [Sphingobacterium spiritivorum]|uniref:hypothetical protein n=1 Tax=Sphingobacterium spiritivorum TaxID=258 RepID=UPI003DA3FF7D
MKPILYLSFICLLSSCNAVKQNTSKSKELIRDCPEEKITNKMPGPAVKGEKERSYYIYKGKRKEISDFDAAWISQNCEVKETVVY